MLRLPYFRQDLVDISMDDEVKHQKLGADPVSAATPTERPRLQSATLLQGHTSIEIEHRSEIYRLQLTRQGKLILTK